MVTLTFQITEDAFNLLKLIDENDCAEYRDTEFPTIDDFRKSESYLTRTDEWFLERNFGGTYYLIYELERCNLVECDGESWHITYQLTEFGKEVLNNNLKLK